MLRAVGQTFRPEFQNRLDKVIVFRPLSRELMRGILKKELSRVLERRGFKDREWAVEWEASALEFLLEKGFSPEMGARPLKRAIDQYLIAPLAATIVEKRFPEGDQFVFVRSDGRAIQAEFVDPDAGGGRRARQPTIDGELPALPAMILAPQGSDAELRTLEAEIARVDETHRVARNGRRSRPSFRRAMMDARILVGAASASRRWRVWRSWIACARPPKRPHSLKARLDKGTERAGKSSRELVSRIALQLHLVRRRHQGRARWRADRGRARGRAGVREARRRARQRAHGAASCSTCTAAGPQNGTCS